MQSQVKKPQKNKNQTPENQHSTTLTNNSTQFRDNRPEAIIQKKIQAAANTRSQTKQAAQLQTSADTYSTQQQPLQKKENKTGLPDKLKSGIENLSGYSMDDVKVHYNSNKPTQLQAHAYAQGTDIHLASGQEKHLPHEAWHVVQQKQGRVKPTMQMKGKVNINDDVGLEKEADVMGARAFNYTQKKTSNTLKEEIVLQQNSSSSDAPVQGLWKELLIGALLLLNPAGLQSDGKGSIRRRPLSAITGPLDISERLGGSRLGVLGDLGSVDSHTHDENFGVYHEQIFLDPEDLSKNIGMFDTGIEPDGLEYLQHYRDPVIDDLDSNILKQAVEIIKEKWKTDDRKYELFATNCQVFADEVLQEYYKLAPSFETENWGVWIGKKFIELDDKYAGYLNKTVEHEVDELIPDIRKMLTETLQENPFAQLALSDFDSSLEDWSILKPIESIFGTLSSTFVETSKKVLSKQNIKRAISVAGQKKIEDSLSFIPEGSLKETLYSGIVNKLVDELYNRFNGDA